MKDSISKGLRRLTPQIIAVLCGNIATDPDMLKGLKEILNSRTVNSFEPSTISPRVWFNSSGLRHDRLEERACCYWSHRKSACYGESASPAKIPHRKYVDNLDEEVLYDDVQCTSMDFDKQQQPPQPRPTKNAPNSNAPFHKTTQTQSMAGLKAPVGRNPDSLVGRRPPLPYCPCTPQEGDCQPRQ